METQEMVKLLEIERECVKRGSTCDRQCDKCKLVQPTEDLLKMYDEVIWLIADDPHRRVAKCVEKLRDHFSLGYIESPVTGIQALEYTTQQLLQY